MVDLPDLDHMSKSNRSTAVISTFFSAPESIHAKDVYFTFPLKQLAPSETHNIRFCKPGGPGSGSAFLVRSWSGHGVLQGFRPDEIHHLVMQGPLVDDFSTKAFQNWSELNNLDLNWADVTDRSIENIQRLPKLQFLHVSNTHISAAGLSRLNLQKFNSLEASDVAYVPQVLPKTKNENFEVLKLCNAGLKDSDMRDVAQLHKLVVLDVSDNELTDRGIELLIPLQRLEQFWFTSNKITPKCLQSLQKMRGLRGVTLTMSAWTPKDKADFIEAAKKFNCSVSDYKPKVTVDP